MNNPVYTTPKKSDVPVCNLERNRTQRHVLYQSHMAMRLQYYLRLSATLQRKRSCRLLKAKESLVIL